MEIISHYEEELKKYKEELNIYQRREEETKGAKENILGLFFFSRTCHIHLTYFQTKSSKKTPTMPNPVHRQPTPRLSHQQANPQVNRPKYPDTPRLPSHQTQHRKCRANKRPTPKHRVDYRPVMAKYQMGQTHNRQLRRRRWRRDRRNSRAPIKAFARVSMSMRSIK